MVKVAQWGVDRVKLVGERYIAKNERMQRAAVEIAQYGIHGLGSEGVLRNVVMPCIETVLGGSLEGFRRDIHGAVDNGAWMVREDGWIRAVNGLELC